MPDTHFYLPDATIPRLVSVYQKTDEGLVEMQRSFANPADRDGAYFSGAGGLAGTASDYLRFGQIVADISQARSLQSPASFGWNGAFSTSFWVDPTEDMVHLVLAQTLFHPTFTSKLWADVETLMNQAIIG